MAVMIVAHPIPGFSGRVTVEDVGLSFIGGFTGPTNVPAAVQAQLVDEGFTLNASASVGYPLAYVTHQELEDPDSEPSVALRAAFGRITSPTPEAFNLPLLNAGTGVNPTVVIGIDPVTGIIYGADRPTNDLSMSADGGVTWQHDRNTPVGVNHVQLHKVIRYGAHIYLFAISATDQRAGVYRAVAPTAATDLISWEVARTNLITNPSFEAGTTGWAAGGTPSLTNPTDGGFSGTRYARLTATDSSIFTFNGNTFPVTAGQQYAFSAYVRGSAALQANIRVTWTGATSTGGTAQALASTTAWQRISATGTVPAGATAARVDVRVGTGMTAGAILDVDAVLAELGTATVGAYIDTVENSRYALMKASTSVSGPNFETLNGKATAFAVGTSALMLGDYGDFTGGPTIQRSLNGTTWTTVWSSATSRHVHGVAEDPFHPGTWYATIGDGSANAVGILRSTDNGANWSTIVTGTGGNVWQAVQLSFSAKYVYLAGDHYGGSAFYFERGASPTIRNLTFGSHAQMPVPGGVAGRIITDLATTSGSTTVTSASFTALDKGRTVRSDNVPLFAAISNPGEANWLTAAGAGTATLRKAATATATGQTAIIGGDRFYAGSYFGAVDPATDVFYFAATDTSSIGNTDAIFAVPYAGASPVLIGAVPNLPTNWRPTHEVFVFNGWVYCGGFRLPAIAA